MMRQRNNLHLRPKNAYWALPQNNGRAQVPYILPLTTIVHTRKRFRPQRRAKPGAHTHTGRTATAYQTVGLRRGTYQTVGFQERAGKARFHPARRACLVFTFYQTRRTLFAGQRTACQDRRLRQCQPQHGLRFTSLHSGFTSLHQPLACFRGRIHQTIAILV